MDFSQNTSSSPDRRHGQNSSVGGREDPAEFYKRKISALEDTLNRREEDWKAKKRYISIHVLVSMILLTHFNNSKLCSQTQPGWGIRKIVDLFHDLSDLLGKADKHVAETNLDPAELEEINTIDFLGLTEDEINDERKEWVDLTGDFGDSFLTASGDSRKRCYVAVQLLNTLIPGFQEKVDNAEDLDAFLAPVGSLSACFRASLMSPLS